VGRGHRVPPDVPLAGCAGASSSRMTSRSRICAIAEPNAYRYTVPDSLAQPRSSATAPEPPLGGSGQLPGTVDGAPLVTGQGAGLRRGPGHGSPMSGSMSKARNRSPAALTAGPTFSVAMTTSQLSAARSSGRCGAACRCCRKGADQEDREARLAWFLVSLCGSR
jgi:hypothetical protein